MRGLLLGLAFVIVCLSLAQAQEMMRGTDYYLDEFNWRITVPDGFSVIDPVEWDRMKNGAENSNIDSSGLDVSNRNKTVLVFKSSDFNYFESNWQPFDTIRGDYRLACKAINENLYETFLAQVPDARIDTSSTTQLLSGLEFQKFVVDMELPNGYAFRAYMFSRLFGSREFSVNLFYLDGQQGTLMMDAWLHSSFQ